MLSRLLVLLLCLYSSMSMALFTPDQLRGNVPHDYMEHFQEYHLKCAELVSENNFDEVQNTLEETYCSKEYIEYIEKTCSDLKRVYSSSLEELTAKKDQLDPRFQIKDFIYENILKYFWEEEIVSNWIAQCKCYDETYGANS